MTPLLAAGTEMPAFLPPLVGLVGGAAIVGYVMSSLRVVPIVGFLVAGVLIGPEQLGIVGDRDVVDAAAEIGVILLLFSIGIEFSLERLARISRLVFLGGGLQVGLTIAVVAGLATAGGVAPAPAVFTGLVVSLSSTVIVLKLLPERGELSTPRGQTGLAVLIFQDLAVVAMVLAVPMLAGDGGGPGDIALALAKAGALIGGVLVVARRVMPAVLDRVARLCAPEVFLLAVVAICFGTAWAAAALGVSVALGGFLAGLIVSESRHSTHAFGEILPLQTLFSAVFFVSIGMLLDVGFVLERPLLILGAVAGILLVKLAVTGLAVRVASGGWPVAAGTALLLAQVGEFSFVLENVGRSEGLSPLDLGADGSQAFIAATVVLMIATPALTAAGATVERLLVTRQPGAATAVVEPGNGERERAGHVIVAGYGDAARSVIGELRELASDSTILTQSPDGATEASADGLDVLIGDYAKRHILLEAGLRQAKLLIVADDTPERTLQVTELARSLNPQVVIVTRPRGEVDPSELAAAGADHIVTPERASAIGLAIAVRATLGDRAGPRPLSSVIAFTPDPSTGCRHLAEIRPVQPSAYGCEDCLRTGSTWTHLRICLTCGHMGCCDSSPNRHARAHSETEAHPLIASTEPGETWGFCFLDNESIAPDSTPDPVR